LRTDCNPTSFLHICILGHNGDVRSKNLICDLLTSCRVWCKYRGCSLSIYRWNLVSIAYRWTLKRGTGLQQIPSQSTKCRCVLLELVCGVLWVQLGSIGLFHFQVSKFTCLCNIFSNTIYKLVSIYTYLKHLYGKRIQQLTPLVTCNNLLPIWWVKLWY
jgi:hypothetical protein